MQQASEKLAPYEARLNDLRERMIRAIGIHTVNVLLERAIYEAAQAHPELSLIEQTDAGLSYNEMERAYANRPEGDIAAAFSDLTTGLLLILARLLGKEMADRLAQEIKARQAQEAAAAEGAKAP